MKKNILLISLSLGILIILGIGFSYSLWNISVSQDNINVATTKCFNVEITSQKNNIALENAYPISNEKGKKLTPFSFTITNTCNIFASYTVNLESLKDTTLSSKFINAMINNEEIKRLSDYETTDTVNTGSIESHTLAKGSLGSGDSEGYTLRVWIDYDTTMEDLDNETKTFKSKIVVKAQPSNWNPIDEGYTTLHDAILANEYQTTPEAAIKKIEAKGTPNFSETAPIVEWESTIGAKTSITVSKPHPSIIGNSNYGGQNLMNDDDKLGLGTNYIFNQKTGNYIIGNVKYLDPTEIDYNGDYYYCYAGTNINSDGIISTFDNFDCTTLYKITSASKKATGEENTNKYRITYTLNAIKIIQKETESDKSDKGLYKAEDDYGITYYYRGNVKNNNVYFANAYWQIIRINGNNSIRLLYNGTNINENNNIGNSNFNDNKYNPAYEGYMYGNIIDTRENMIKNEVSSTIKEVLDNWYKNNIFNKNFNNYIDDAGFCNSRKIFSGDGESLLKNTFYRNNDYNVSFKCPNVDNDLFTNRNASIGNKALTYSIGLPTYDELMAAGLNPNSINRLSYAYSLDNYWSITPSYYDAGAGCIKHWHLNSDGYLDLNYRYGNYTVRPVISLKSNVEISGGIGTINEPFMIKTE